MPNNVLASVQVVGVKTFNLSLNDPVVYDGSGTLSFFDIDGDFTFVNVTQTGPNTIAVEMAIADGAGLPWNLTASPPEIDTPCDPGSGVTV